MVKRILIVALKIAFVATATGLAWFNLAVAIMFVASVLIVAFADKISSLVEVSFGPLKAKLERDVSKAEDLLNELRKVALIQAKAGVATSARTGRWSEGQAWNYELVSELQIVLRDLGASDDDIRAACADFVHFTLIDLRWAILGGSYAPVDLGVEAMAEYTAMSRSLSSTSPQAIREWLEKWDQMNPDRAVRLADMEWIIENRQVRDREQFQRSQVAVPWKEGQT